MLLGNVAYIQLNTQFRKRGARRCNYGIPGCCIESSKNVHVQHQCELCEWFSCRLAHGMPHSSDIIWVLRNFVEMFFLKRLEFFLNGFNSRSRLMSRRPRELGFGSKACRIRGEPNGTRVLFSSASVSPPNYHSTNCFTYHLTSDAIWSRYWHANLIKTTSFGRIGFSF
jgi:hypothetical protein